LNPKTQQVRQSIKRLGF